jgi:hypothetical protein
MEERQDYFYEWDGLANQWLVTEEQFDQDYPSVPYSNANSVAEHIIVDTFGLTLDNSSINLINSIPESKLPGYDVKGRDGYEMIMLSLATGTMYDKLLECYMDEEGIVKFYEIGDNTSNIKSDVLYAVSTGDLVKQVDNVLVLGYDPPPKRYTKTKDGTNGYNLFTLAQDYADNSKYIYDDQTYDPDLDAKNYPLYWVWGDWLSPESCGVYQEGYIEYADPNFNQVESFGLGRANDIYNYKTEKIDQWLYKISVPFFSQGHTTVEFSQSTPRFYELESMGTLQQMSWRSSNDYSPQVCLQQGGTWGIDTYGVELPDSDKKKFLGVREVWILGIECKQIDIDVTYSVQGQKVVKGAGRADFLVQVDTLSYEPYRLSQGQDYIVVKPENGSKHKIIFACNMNPYYVDHFGGSINQNLHTYRINPQSIWPLIDHETNTVYPNTKLCDDSEGIYTINDCTGYLKDGTAVGSFTTYNGCIFPTGEGTSGYIVKKIVVIYDWANPCVVVRDTRATINYAPAVSETNLQRVSIEMFPIITKDEPQPAVINGDILDSTEIIADPYPDTEQNLEQVPYARAFAQLESGDIKLTMPFADANQCVKICNFVTGLYAGENIESTTYVCDPNAEPMLGEKIDGKTINAIDYSYQDSSQYLISVTAGPIWQGMRSWDNSVYTNKTERLELKGTVTWVSNNNMRCNVKLEKIGVMECINNSKTIIEVGDTVSVSVFNNPVSK